MTDLAYRTGTTPTAVHGTDAVMVLSGEASALELWNVVSSDGWSDMQVLDVLTVGGLSSVPDFCAVVIRGSRATILARGGCTATVTRGGQREQIDGTSVSTWVEKSIEWSDDTVVELAAGDVTGDVDLPVASGVVMAGLVRVGVHAAVVTKEVPVEDAALEPSAPEPVDEALSEPSEPEDSVEEVEEAPDTTDGPVADPNATLADVDESSFDAMFGATVPGRRLEDAAIRELVPDQAPIGAPPASPVASPPPASTPAVAGDHDGRTMTAAELARLRGDVAAARPTPAATPVVPQISATLDFSTGRSVLLDRPAVIGRSPRAHGSTSVEMPQLVVIDNPYVSGTHLIAAIDDGVVVVTDMSTNGTLVRPPGEEPRRLDKGRETVVVDGSILSLSDDVTATVVVTGGR